MRNEQTSTWTSRRSTLFKLYYGEGKTLAEIGRCYGVTRERIRQVMEKLGIARELRRSLAMVGGYRGGGPGSFRFKTLDDYFGFVRRTGKELKAQLLRLFPKKHCKDCDSTGTLHLHHLQYPALSSGDIEVLCQSCHEARHRGGNGKQVQLEICQKYLQGQTPTMLGLEYDIDPRNIRYFLRRWGIRPHIRAAT